MGARFTASKTALLFGCRYPFREDVELPPEHIGEAAERGTRIHGYAEQYISSMTMPPPVPHASDVAVWAALRPWLDKVKGRAKDVWSEAPYALDIEAGTSKLLRIEARDYGDHPAHVVPGTADIVYLGDGDTMPTVLDLKTGDRAYVQPANENAQLRTLGLAVARHRRVHNVRVGLVFVSEDGIHEETAELGELDLETHRVDLLDALASVPGAAPAPGPHCRYCPARTTCPAVEKAMVALPAMAVSTMADVARIYPLLGPIGDALAAVKAAIREVVEANDSVPLANGKRLRLVKQDGRETVSIGSVRKAMGDAKVDELRAAGAIVRGASFLALKETK